MIMDLDRTIKQLLTAELPIKNGEIDVQFDQPTREWSARLTRPTVNFFLYDIRENNVLRQHQWETVPLRNLAANSNEVTQKRTPFRLDCYYMMTAWAAEPHDEHRLLARSIAALLRHPILPETELVGEMRKQPFKVQSRLASHDKLTNPAEVWSSLDNELRPSISYLITVALDPWEPVTGPAVRTLTLQTGQTEAPAYRGSFTSGPATTLTIIGGTISQEDEPAAGIQVALKGTGWFNTTNTAGQFTFTGIPPGNYTLVVWPEADDAGPREPVEKPISVPNGDYNVSL